MKSLKGKLRNIHVFLVVIIALIGITAVSNFYHLANSINGLMTDNYKSIKSIAHMNQALEQQNMSALDYIQIGSETSIDQFLDRQADFYSWYEAEANNITEAGEESVVKGIKQDYVKYLSQFTELRKIRDTRGSGAALQHYHQRMSPIVASLKKQLQSITTMNETTMFENRTKVNASALNSMYILMFISVLATIIGISSSSILTNKFLKPLQVLQKNMQQVSEGNIQQQVPITTDDEIGVLSLEFNKMLARLQKFEHSTKGKLMEERNRSVALIKSISDPLVMLGNDYSIILVNNACEQFFEFQEKDALGSHFLEVFRSNDIFDHIRKIHLANENKHIPKIISISRNGKDFYFDTTVTRIRNDANAIIGLVVLFQNVTKLKKLEKAKTDFVSTISHELKTPLTSIMMGTSLIRSEGLGKLSEKQLEVVSAIEDDAERLSILVNDIIHLSKIESERDVYHMEPCSISEIAEICNRTFNEISIIRQITLQSTVDEALPQVMADPEKISWVINNLIANAIKFTHEGDRITIEAALKDELMEVTVADTGSGIQQESQDRIFERFARLQSYDSDIEGTGLGLSIAKEIVTMHKGTIWCESKLDEGSRFTFTLPIVRS